MTGPHPADWLRENDPASLERRLERMLSVLDRATGTDCAHCGDTVCGHMVLFSLAAGFEDAPCCPACLADELERPLRTLREGLLRYVMQKDCLRRGWALAGHRESASDPAQPTCVYPSAASRAASATPTTIASQTSNETRLTAAPTSCDSRWDAGDKGCGDLVLELRLRLKALPSRAVVHLTATDPGAPADLPAWCGLTGHRLLFSEHPEYWIQRKD